MHACISGTTSALLGGLCTHKASVCQNGLDTWRLNLFGKKNMANKPKRHHFLPQSYLRGFGRDEVLWVYDRNENAVRAQKVVDTAVKKHFYSIEKEDGSRDPRVESEFLSKIDRLIPLLVGDLRKGLIFNEINRSNLAVVTAIMMNRTLDFHEGINRVEGGLIKKLSQMMVRTEDDAARLIQEWRLEDPDTPEISPKELFEFFRKGRFKVKIHRNRSIEHLIQLSPELANVFANLNVIVLHAPEKAAFITTDRPVVVMPPRDTSEIPKWGGVGLLTPGALKFFPLASDLAIIFGEPGSKFRHTSLSQKEVKVVNSIIGYMTDRFMIGRDRALIEAWSRRLNLADTPKVPVMNLA